jgi:hypothetical protein
MNLEGLTEKVSSSKWKTIYYVNCLEEIVAKVCGNCSETKTMEEYSKSKVNLGGREAHCKACRSEQRKVTPLYRKRNRPKLEERGGIVGKVCSGCCEWKCLNSFHNHKIKLGNRESLCKVCKTARKRNWSQNNPEKISIQDALRRARKSALPNTLTATRYTVTLEFFDNACALTGIKSEIEIDHAIPIAIGHGGTTFENCYPLTKSLNGSKCDRNIFEWFEANRQRFELEQERFDRLIEWLGKANGMTAEEYRAYVYECHANPNEINDAEAN